VRMKLSWLNGAVLNATPEYEDCQKLAAERAVPLKQVIAAASFEYQKISEPLARDRAASGVPARPADVQK